MTKRRGYGDGGIDERGENVFRLRYRVGGKRYAKTFHGTSTEARRELRGFGAIGRYGRSRRAGQVDGFAVDRSMD
jgi:integrase